MGHSSVDAVDPQSVLSPIPGEPIDPPPRPAPRPVARLESQPGLVGTVVDVGYRTTLRFTLSRATLLAAGTTYYLFLALFSVIAIAYGVAAALGAEQLADYVTEALQSAFPGLLDEGGIDPADLRSTGQATSAIGAVGLLYSATGGVFAATRSLHSIYGAPKNPRNPVLVRVWSLGWFFVLAPLMLLSFVASTFTANLSSRLLRFLGIEWSGPSALLTVSALALTLALNFLVVLLLLGRLGGIRPPRRPLLIGSAVGAVVVEALKLVMALLLGFVVDKPQYGALAAPIGVMFVLYLQCGALFGVASLTAALAERSAGRAVRAETDPRGARRTPSSRRGTTPSP
jgi:membrane protein